jgi:chromosome segregation ATPase
MKRIMRALHFLMPVLLMTQLLGCIGAERRGDATRMPASVDREPLQASVAKTRFQDSASQGAVAVDSAIELSEKYARLSEEAATLRQENKDLTGRNQQLRDQATNLKAQLEQTQKELTEATDIMREMLIELNNWKANVLGFRAEMREAEKAQLEALLRILRVLGGDVQLELAGGENKTSTVVTASEMAEAQEQDTTGASESND